MFSLSLQSSSTEISTSVENNIIYRHKSITNKIESINKEIKKITEHNLILNDKMSKLIKKYPDLILTTNNEKFKPFYIYDGYGESYLVEPDNALYRYLCGVYEHQPRKKRLRNVGYFQVSRPLEDNNAKLEALNKSLVKYKQQLIDVEASAEYQKSCLQLKFQVSETWEDIIVDDSDNVSKDDSDNVSKDDSDVDSKVDSDVDSDVDSKDDSDVDSKVDSDVDSDVDSKDDSDVDCFHHSDDDSDDDSDDISDNVSDDASDVSDDVSDDKFKIVSDTFTIPNSSYIPKITIPDWADVESDDESDDDSNDNIVRTVDAHSISIPKYYLVSEVVETNSSWNSMDSRDRDNTNDFVQVTHARVNRSSYKQTYQSSSYKQTYQSSTYKQTYQSSTPNRSKVDVKYDEILGPYVKQLISKVSSSLKKVISQEIPLYELRLDTEGEVIHRIGNKKFYSTIFLDPTPFHGNGKNTFQHVALKRLLISHLNELFNKQIFVTFEKKSHYVFLICFTKHFKALDNYKTNTFVDTEQIHEVCTSISVNTKVSDLIVNLQDDIPFPIVQETTLVSDLKDFEETTLVSDLKDFEETTLVSDLKDFEETTLVSDLKDVDKWDSVPDDYGTYIRFQCALCERFKTESNCHIYDKSSVECLHCNVVYCKTCYVSCIRKYMRNHCIKCSYNTYVEPLALEDNVLVCTPDKEPSDIKTSVTYDNAYDDDGVSSITDVSYDDDDTTTSYIYYVSKYNVLTNEVEIIEKKKVRFADPLEVENNVSVITPDKNMSVVHTDSVHTDTFVLTNEPFNPDFVTESYGISELPMTYADVVMQSMTNTYYVPKSVSNTCMYSTALNANASDFVPGTKGNGVQTPDINSQTKTINIHTLASMLVEDTVKRIDISEISALLRGEKKVYNLTLNTEGQIIYTDEISGKHFYATLYFNPDPVLGKSTQSSHHVVFKKYLYNVMNEMFNNQLYVTISKDELHSRVFHISFSLRW